MNYEINHTIFGMNIYCYHPSRLKEPLFSEKVDDFLKLFWSTYESLYFMIQCFQIFLKNFSANGAMTDSNS